MADAFKSAQHALNWKALTIKKMNKKQPVKQYTDEERAALAASMNLSVSNKPPVPLKQRKTKQVETVNDEVNLEHLPEELKAVLGLNEEESE